MICMFREQYFVLVASFVYSNVVSPLKIRKYCISVFTKHFEIGDMNNTSEEIAQKWDFFASYLDLFLKP